MSCSDAEILAVFDQASRSVAAMSTVPLDRTPITHRVIRKWVHGLAEGERFQYGPMGRAEDAIWSDCGHIDYPSLCLGLGDLPGYLMCRDCWMMEISASSDSCDWCGTTRRRGVDVYPTVCNLGPAVVLIMLCDSHVATPDRSMA